MSQQNGNRKRPGDSENGCRRQEAERINPVWNYDFVPDWAADSRRLKLLVVLDESTKVEHRIKAQDVLRTLEYLLVVHGTRGTCGVTTCRAQSQDLA